MYFKKLAVLLLLCTGGIADIQGQERCMTLKDCVSYAESKNNDIRAAKIEEKIAREKIREVTGSGLPQFSINGNITNNLQLPVQLLPGDYFGAPGTYIPAKFGTKYNFTFTGQLSQLVFSGSFWVGLSAARESTEYYRQNTESITDQAVYNVSTAYYQTMVIQKQIKLLEYNLVSIEKVLEDTKLKFENGKAREIDVDRLSVNQNNLEYQLKKAKEGLRQSYNLLKFSIGMPLESGISLADSSFFSQDNLSAGTLTNLHYSISEDIEYSNRAEYRMLQSGLALQKLNRKNELTQYLPTLRAVGSYTFQAQREKADLFDAKKDWFKYYSVGLQLNIPIITGGQTYSKIKQASLAIEKMNQNIERAERGIDLEMSNALIKYNNALDNISSENLNVSLARKIYSSTQLEYREGTITASVLIDAETKLREAQTNYISSLLDLYIARLDVEKAKGSLKSYINSL